jgi:hypothetical protein
MINDHDPVVLVRVRPLAKLGVVFCVRWRDDAVMSVLSKDEVLEVLRRTGAYNLVEGHESELPEVIDTDRDEAILERLGIYRSSLMESLGSSP